VNGNFGLKVGPFHRTDAASSCDRKRLRQPTRTEVGLGITPTTSWACRQELEAGELIHLFPDWTMGELPAHAYFPMGRTTRLAARAFIDFIAAELRIDRG
jgi:DNA-binding transcriptional LysR family regulator